MSKQNVKLSGSAISSKWNRNMKNSVSDIQAGIDRVTESPMEKAVAKQDKMKANLNKAIDNGSWAKGMLKTKLPDWKQNTKTKVGERLGSGVDAAMGKRQEFDNWLVNRLNGVLPEIASMPDMTLQDSINRMVKMTTYMAEQKYKTA